MYIIYLSIYLSIDRSIYLSIDRSIYLSIDQSIYRSIYLSMYMYMEGILVISMPYTPPNLSSLSVVFKPMKCGKQRNKTTV